VSAIGLHSSVLAGQGPADSVQAPSIVKDSVAEMDSTMAQRSRVVVEIQRVLVDDGRVNDTLDVLLETFGLEIGGFELKIGCPTELVEITAVLPGEILDSCDWEMFTARPVTPPTELAESQGWWQAVGLARSFGQTTPKCFGLDRKASIIRLVLSNEFRADVPDTTVPLYFVWDDCSDNGLSSAAGNALFISEQVYEYFDPAFSEAGDQFPTLSGIPRSCVKGEAVNRPIRAVDFHHGGIEFRLDIGLEDPEPDSVRKN